MKKIVLTILLTVNTVLSLSLDSPIKNHALKQNVSHSLHTWQKKQCVFSMPEQKLFDSPLDLINVLEEVINKQNPSPTKPILEEFEDILHTISNNPEQNFFIANTLFDYFVKQNPLTFLQLHYNCNKKAFLLALYTAFWNYLCKTGWNHWHQNCLANLQTFKDVIYIAGGFDFYQPLINGVKNITIIDPYLPGQQRYYPENYEYFLYGKPNNQIDFLPPNDNLSLRRKESSNIGWFSLTTEQGSLMQLPHLKTIWQVEKDNSRHGSLIFERKNITQKDLSSSPDKAFLISFNELFFFLSPSFLNGWGINIAALPDDFILFVKQLASPLTKNDLITLRISYLLNATEINFVALGNDIS